MNLDKVRLINFNGKQIGIVSLANALKISKDNNLDLIEVNSKENPPIYKMMSYKKFLYEKKKKKKMNQKKQKVVCIKEIKFRLTICENDFNIKMKNILRFLRSKNKIKVSVYFKGREVRHKKMGFDIFYRIKNKLKNLIIVDFISSEIEGKQIFMIFSPKI